MEGDLGIDAAIRRRWFDLTLPPTLEADFERWSSASRRRELQILLMVILLLVLCFLLLDAASGQLRLGLVLRLGFQAPTILLSVLLLNREAPPRTIAVAAMLPVATVIVTTMLLARHAAFEDKMTYITVMGVSMMGTTLFFRLFIRHAIAMTFMNVTLYVGLLVPWLADISFGRPGELVFSLASLSCAALIASARRERNEQDLYLLGRSADIQAVELKRVVGELSKLSNLDALTGIGNRRCFDRAVADLWDDAARDQTRLALALIDIDHFKSLNDIAGHAVGDRCLRMVAEAVNQQIRPIGDVAARFGGEEFAVLMPLPSDLVSAVAIAEAMGERLRACIENLRLRHPGSISPIVTVSVGVAVLSPAHDGATPDLLLEAADQAMYDSKHAGRNRMTLASGPRLSAAA